MSRTARPDARHGLVFVLGTFGMNFQITTALMATKEFGKGPQEYGLLGRSWPSAR